MIFKNNNGLINNLVWKFAERITAQVVTLAVSIVLARLLDPQHYGAISMVMIFISIANVFVSDGFGNALIQKKYVDRLDYSSVLFFNIAISLFLYFILFFAAPFICKFYGPEYSNLTPVFRILGLRLILASVNSVQQAYVSRNMIFRKFFLSTFFGTVISGIVGIILAYKGFGVWALVAQYLTNTTVDTIVLSFSLEKFWAFEFSFRRIEKMIPFGIRILGSGLLINVYQELRSLIIGKVYSSSDLAYFDRGKQFPSLIVTNVNSSIGAVLFPKMSKDQESLLSLKNTMKRSIRFSSYLICPLMFGLLAVSNTVVSLILGESWIPCVPYLQLFCLTYLVQPIHTANMQVVKALGKSRLYLYIEIIKKVIELLSLILVMRISVFAIAISMTILNFLFIGINAVPNKKLIGYGFGEQIRDILPPVLMSIVMCIIVYPFGLLIDSSLIALLVQIVCGILLYLVLSIVSKNNEYKYLLTRIKNIVKKKYDSEEGV